MAEARRRERTVMVDGLAVAQRDADEAERRLARAVARALPVLTLVGATAAGVFAGAGSALLVLASGALLGTITFLWASVRTLSGDAPLPVGVALVAADRYGQDALVEQKRRALRALKDLESEHALGKIDDADYQAVVGRYRAEAKAVLRQMDLEIAPLREQAERLARDHLRKRGVAATGPEDTMSGGTHDGVSDGRVPCPKCRESNEGDAAFCKKCGASIKGGAGSDDADR